jgi:hypothetical protein
LLDIAVAVAAPRRAVPRRAPSRARRFENLKRRVLVRV